MLRSIHPLALTAAIALTGLATAFFGTAAHAGGSKEFYVQDYNFKKPMHGYTGHSGDYYCDYQRLPIRKCSTDRSGRERCAVTGWTLRQTCQ